MDESLILTKIKELFRRYRMVTGWLIVSRFLLIGCILAAVLLLLVKVTGFYLRYFPYFYAFILFGVGVGLVIAFLHRTSFMEVALKCDEKLRLKERLSTALEWIQDKNRVRTPMFRALLRDTAQSAESIKPAKVFSFEWKTPLKKISAVTAVLVLIIWIPPLNLFAPKIDPKEVSIINQEAQNIEKKIEELKKKPVTSAKVQKQVKKATASLQKLAKQLNNKDIQKREALAKISRTQDELNKMLEDKKILDKMNDDIRKAMGADKNAGEEDDEKSLEQLAEKMKELAAKLKNEQLTEEEKKELQEQLQGIKKALNDAGMKTEELDQAIENVKQNHQQKAADNLQKMAEKLNQLQKESDEMEQLEDMAQSLQDSKANISGGEGEQFGQGMPKMDYKDSGKKGPADFGTKSTNKEEKGRPGDKSNYTKRFDKDKKNTLNSTYEKLYDPERYEKESASTKIKGQVSKGPSIRSIRSEVRSAPRTGGKAKETATDRYLDYRAEGEEAVKKEKIPGKYKKLIRNYYDSIKPEEQ